MLRGWEPIFARPDPQTWRGVCHRLHGAAWTYFHAFYGQCDQVGRVLRSQTLIENRTTRGQLRVAYRSLLAAPFIILPICPIGNENARESRSRARLANSAVGARLITSIVALPEDSAHAPMRERCKAASLRCDSPVAEGGPAPCRVFALPPLSSLEK